MLADPQSLTINGVVTSFPAIKVGETASTYQSDDQVFRFQVDQQTTRGARFRHRVRLNKRVIAVDPLNSAVSAYKDVSVDILIDEPETGFTDAEIDYMVQALKTWASTANVLKVLAGQH